MTTSFDTAAYVASLHRMAKQHGWQEGVADRGLATHLDVQDALTPLRQEYYLPTGAEVSSNAGSYDLLNGDPQSSSKQSLYLCGNSLGPMARRSKKYIEQEMDAWQRRGVLGHFDHPYDMPWVRYEEKVSLYMSDIVGAKPSEVIAMGTLTANLHSMLATFYRPNTKQLSALSSGGAQPRADGAPMRHKIIHEATAFPSDQYALASAVALAGFDPQSSLVPLQPRDGERTLRTEDILNVLEREAATGELALLLLGNVQYLTGQMFDIPTITKRARDLGIVVGWDLAHAFANVPLALHDWDVDFAVWCTYKYGSSGPGGIAGLFVHERWGKLGFATRIGREIGQDATGASGLPRPSGWWGHQKSTRFAMPNSFDALHGASGWQLSNPSVLDLAALLGSLETLAQAPILLERTGELLLEACLPVDFGTQEYAKSAEEKKEPFGMGYIMPALRQKSQRLTAYLEHLLTSCGVVSPRLNIHIVTPTEAKYRGSQLSLCLPDRSLLDNVTTAKTDKCDSTDGNSSTVSADTFVTRIHNRVEGRYGLICDIRNPDMLRIAPVAQYSTFDDVWLAVDALRRAIDEELKLCVP